MNSSNVIVVIQCAGKKRKEAGYLENGDGARIMFVAKPACAPVHEGMIYARPDDDSGDGKTWRQKLLEYNQDSDNNIHHLLPAYQLYQNACYRRLEDAIGASRLFILSAGWGLINASFLTPNYDITFSESAAPCTRRLKNDHGYSDLQQLAPKDPNTRIFFFGGKEYRPLFESLTGNLPNQKTVFYRAPMQGEGKAPQVKNGEAVAFRTTKMTNWHYACADAFLEGNLLHASEEPYY